MRIPVDKRYEFEPNKQQREISPVSVEFIVLKLLTMIFPKNDWISSTHCWFEHKFLLKKNRCAERVFFISCCSVGMNNVRRDVKIILFLFNARVDKESVCFSLLVETSDKGKLQSQQTAVQFYSRLALLFFESTLKQLDTKNFGTAIQASYLSPLKKPLVLGKAIKRAGTMKSFLREMKIEARRIFRQEKGKVERHQYEVLETGLMFHDEMRLLTETETKPEHIHVWPKDVIWIYEGKIRHYKIENPSPTDGDGTSVPLSIYEEVRIAIVCLKN